MMALLVFDDSRNILYLFHAKAEKKQQNKTKRKQTCEKEMSEII